MTEIHSSQSGDLIEDDIRKKKTSKQSDRASILGHCLACNYKNLQTTQEVCTSVSWVLNCKAAMQIRGIFVPLTSEKEGGIINFVRILFFLIQKWDLYLLTGSKNVRLEHLIH